MDRGGEVLEFIRYRYTYDEYDRYGNWTKCTVRAYSDIKDGKESLSEVEQKEGAFREQIDREITYYEH